MMKLGDDLAGGAVAVGVFMVAAVVDHALAVFRRMHSWGMQVHARCSGRLVVARHLATVSAVCQSQGAPCESDGSHCRRPAVWSLQVVEVAYVLWEAIAFEATDLLKFVPCSLDDGLGDCDDSDRPRLAYTIAHLF